MFSEKIPLLETEIKNLELINDSWYKTDSVKTIQLRDCKIQIDQANKSIDHLNKTIKKQRLTYTVGGSIIVVLVCLLVN